MRLFFGIGLIFLLTILQLPAQIQKFPYTENFDSSNLLPSGWTTTSNKDSSGDFTISTSSERSSPNCVSSKDGRIAQSLSSPSFDFTGKFVDGLQFFERRTSTHRSGLIVEAIVAGDTSHLIILSDTLYQESSSSYIERLLPLPSSLDGQHDVRFRWSVLADSSSGSTGVIRFDDIAVTVKKAVDLAVSSVSFSPEQPHEGEPITFTAAITNEALPGNFSFHLQLHDSEEKIDDVPFSGFIDSNDSVSLQLHYPSIHAGIHRLSIGILLPTDEDTSSNTILYSLPVSYSQRSLVVNEIMYAPNDGYEWVEYFNASEDTIDLLNWSISDRNTAKQVADQSIDVLPGRYVLLAKDSSFKDSYPDFTGQIVQVSSMPTLNNDSDGVVLIDHTGLTIDSVMYHSEWGGTDGRSLERIDATLPSTAQSNWAVSHAPLGATPGTINSVTKKEFDAAVTSISFDPSFPVLDQNTVITAYIKNIGKKSLANIAIEIYSDQNNDSGGQSEELFAVSTIALLHPGDSIAISHIIPLLPQGTHSFIVSVSLTTDDDRTNNISFSTLTIGIPPGSLVVNEIMYAPPGDMPEWIELYNRRGNRVDVRGWKISDSGPNNALLRSDDVNILPGEYCIVTSDTTGFKSYFSNRHHLIEASFSALNNSSPDAVVLYDNRGAVIDSVYYQQSWGGLNGMSLQRFDAESASSDSVNWNSGTPTPGKENFIVRKDNDLEISSLTAERMADGIRVLCTLKNIGRNEADGSVVHFYVDKNFDSIPEESEMIGSENAGSIVANDSTTISFGWEAHFTGTQRIIAQVVFTGDEQENNNILTVSIANRYPGQSIVINEIMYEPESGNAEFVELFNPSTDSIDLSGWTLMDTPSSSGKRAVITLSPSPLFIQPNGFFVAASDSNFVNTIPIDRRNRICINSSLSLSNGGEDIILSDLTGAQIDSVHYYPGWHLKDATTTGRSLERISPLVSGNDPRNWSSCVDPAGSTPLARNSIFTQTGETTQSLTLSPNPFSPDGDGFDDFLSINYALPSSSSRIRVRIYDVQGHLVKRLAQNELSPSQGTIIWNGSNDNGNTVRIGMYIILFQAFDNFGNVLRTMKDVAVVAAKL